MAKITGRFGPFSTLPTANQSRELYIPIVTVGLANDPRGTETRGTTTLLANDLIAVIDTGSQLCAIDPPIALRSHLPVLREDEIAGSSGIAKRSIFRGQLFFPETGALYELQFSGTPLRSAGWEFDVIIGWELLRLFDLRISKRNGLVELQP